MTNRDTVSGKTSIVGLAETTYYKHGKAPVPEFQLALEAIQAAAEDAGIDVRHAFGWADHHEISRWVELGVSPAEAIVAATSRPAALLGIADMGTLAAGKSADFIVLTANPLENIRNTRTIASVYLRGTMLNRDALAAKWRSGSRAQ